MPLIKINYKWIKGWNVRPEIIKLLLKSGGMVHDIGLGEEFLEMRPSIKETKAKTKKWDYIKLQNFCTEKNQKDEKVTYVVGKIFQTIYQIISKIYEELIHFNKKD